MENVFLSTFDRPCLQCLDFRAIQSTNGEHRLLSDTYQSIDDVDPINIVLI